MMGASGTPDLEIRMVWPGVAPSLGEFFHDLVQAGDEKWFHPHPLTAARAKDVAEYRGKDYYCVVLVHDRVLGYGMLRGWDEGYAIPSLGIAIHPTARSTGLSAALMLFLHAAARLRGASVVRLTVARRNRVAVALYESLGYKFEDAPGHQLVGHLSLAREGHSGP